MNRNEIRRYQQLVNRLKIPADRKNFTQANLRWLIANAWIENRNNPELYELIRLIQPHA